MAELVAYTMVARRFTVVLRQLAGRASVDLNCSNLGKLRCGAIVAKVPTLLAFNSHYLWEFDVACDFQVLASN